MRINRMLAIIVLLTASVLRLAAAGTSTNTYEDAVANLKSTDVNVRSMGIRYFLPGSDDSAPVIPVPGSYDLLLKVLDNDEEEPIRCMAASALSMFKEDRSIESILKLLENKGGPWREYFAYRSIGNIGTEKAISLLTQRLKDSDGHDTVDIISGLGNAKSDNVVNIIAPYLNNGTKNINGIKDIRNAAIEALGINGSPQAYTLLLPLIGDKKDNRIYELVLTAMARVNSKEAHEFVFNALSDDDLFMRKAASNALYMMNDEGMIEVALKGLKESKDEKVRLSDIRYLSKFPTKFPIDPLLDALKDDSASVRRALVRCIGERYEPSAFTPLNTHMRDSDASVVDAVLMVFAQSNDKRAVDSLIWGLNNKSSLIRLAIVKGLTNLGGKKAVSPIASLANREQDINVLKAILISFNKLNDTTTPATIVKLIQRIHEQEQQMEKDAAETLKTLTGNEYTGDPKDWK